MASLVRWTVAPLLVTAIAASALAPSTSADAKHPEEIDPIGRARLLTPDDRFANLPAASKNAQFVVYHRLNPKSDGYVHWDVYWLDRRTHEERRVSVGIDGIDQPADSRHADISWDGRFVVYGSEASNLVPGDTNGSDDVFLYDAQTEETTLVSRAESGTLGRSDSSAAKISRNGRYVSFTGGSGLHPDDTNLGDDVFVYDRVSGELDFVSRAADGGAADASSVDSAVSGDGRFVVFASYATDLVEEEEVDNPWTDLFMRDRQTGITTRVSRTADGGQPDGGSRSPSLSRTGKKLAFVSRATNLAPGGAVGFFDEDVFLYDVATGTTKLVNTALDGQIPDGDSSGPAISGNGRFVAFQSNAENLVPYETNRYEDIFLYDDAYETIFVVSHGWDGSPVDRSGSYGAELGASSRYVLFNSFGTNVVRDDEDDSSDVYFYRVTKVGLRS